MNSPSAIAQPSWTDAQLADAVRASTNWRSVMLLLGLGERAKSAGAVRVVMGRLDFLRVAAGTLAATWFMLRGCVVSFPAEPARYDLLADTPQGLREFR